MLDSKCWLCLIAWLANKSAQKEEPITINLMDSFNEKVNKHESNAKNLSAKFFQNENINGLIRQFFPKKTQFNYISDQ